MRLCLHLLAPAFACMGLAACSPEFNWREVRPAGTRLQAQMPCKPEEATRAVPLAGTTVQMHLAGCDAGGATFVIGWTSPAASRVGAVLGDWQDSTLSSAGIAAGPDAPVGRPFGPPGAMALPQAVRLKVQGHAPDGAALPLEAAWFAAAGEAGPEALFAAVYRQPERPEASDTFFTGLRLR
ncbi:hypothetical protein GT347_14500 [Xylophilus rhododendri]|uniref:Lipoprotein n=1 Tax=Xylophilus rhododendri TaxID=2697032 RepID=A0A857J7P1_9BURK|nr:hypothetical protein [Xylophilus rhododendri]QHI99089.1 hypothetical protein GT347_14500 [Xylophilus rhododendri]